MRVSPDTSKDWWKHSATIDGESVNGLLCVEADEEQGYIVCQFGKPFAELLDQDGRPRTYTRYGEVVITPPLDREAEPLL